MTSHRWIPLAALALAVAAPSAPAVAQSPGYRVLHTYTVGGDGFWDYLTLDTMNHRLFIGRDNRIMVVDPGSGKVLGTVPGMKRAHGVAFDYAKGHGFATSGSDSTVTMFDIKTLKVLGRTKAAVDDDGIAFDPATGNIFTFNGDAASASVIDGATGKLLGNVPLGAKPEFGVSAADGKVYVNLESTSMVAEIDAKAMKVTRRWALAPCENPSGLAIDRVHHILFSGCRNKVMAMSDATTGKLITTLPIGAGVDATRYDPATGLAFASCGDGTLTVIHEDSPTKFRVVQTVTTMRGARTMELNPENHDVYTVTAKFGPMPAQAQGGRRRRPPMIPGSFTLLVLGR